MFEWILPHQIILLWTTITVLTGLVVSILITEGKNPLYMLANIFLCGFVGTVFGGIFVAITNALIWEAWSLLIPVFIGGIVSYMMAIYLKDYIPKPRLNVRPVAMIMAVAMIILLSFSTVMTALPSETKIAAPYTNFRAYNVGDVRLLSLPNSGTYDLSSSITKLDFNKVAFNSIASATDRVRLDSYHTSIEFPTKLAEEAHEGDYIRFRLNFGVPETSPVDWQMPAWTIMCWADIDGQLGLSDGDAILSEQFFKIPTFSDAGQINIYTSAPCVYDADGEPMWAMYGVNTANGYQLLPITFASWAKNWWKDDEQYTFANTPEGWSPPHDQASWQIDASGQLIPKEEIDYWLPIEKGDTVYVNGKLYCPKGMTNYSGVWYLSIVAYDYAYSTTQIIAAHTMSFEVSPTEAPVVNISSSWWVEMAMFGVLTLVAIAAIKYGKELI